MKITEFSITLSKENVLASIDVDPNSDLYEEIEEEFEEMLPRAYEKIQPVALLAFGDMEDYRFSCGGEIAKTALFGIHSVGKGLSEWSTQLFAEGDYLKGMLADAMADDYLFQMDEAVQGAVLELCREQGYGIAARLEAPHDIPLSIQKRAFDVTEAEQEIGLKIKESFMYDPVKTVCQVYVLDRNTSRFHNAHDCSRCTNLTCKRRKIPGVTVCLKTGSSEQKIIAEKQKSLLRTLQEQQIFLSAVCGGKGTCGKCRVRVLQGAPVPTEADKKYFTKEELEQGYRLACRFYPEEDCVVELEEGEEEFEVIAEQNPGKEKRIGQESGKSGQEAGETEQEAGKSRKEAGETGKETGKSGQEAGRSGESAGETGESGQNAGEAGEYGIAVDIGTTTIAMQLVDLKSGQAADVYTAINRQRAFGADVISRIETSNSGLGEELRRSIQRDLLKGLKTLLSGKTCRLRSMVIGANTTMVHLLMGYSCVTLGVAPFTPVNIDTIQTTFGELFESQIRSGTEAFSGEKTLVQEELPVTICPGISTYVGGDILAGMYALGFDRMEKVNVLIDLGTNGEMVIGNKDRILAASTAAGPAFEGGNIICGTGSIPGAICSVSVEREQVQIGTIGEKAPTGICGTGVIDTMYELLRQEIIDETGRMEDPWFDEGFLLAKEDGKEIRFYQKDVREIQLAKSAVRAGLETLMSRYGVTYSEIENIYIAGGFGYKMDIRKAAGIGLLPEECLAAEAEAGKAKTRQEGIIHAVGNSCLAGVKKCLTESGFAEVLQGLKEHSEEVSLSEDPLFQELYLDYMFFE